MEEQRSLKILPLMMHTVELKPLMHRGAECIGIYSPLSNKLNYLFEKKAGAKWSQSKKCWYVPCTAKNYELLAKALKGIAILQVNELKQYLLERKKSGYANPLPKQAATILQPVKKTNDTLLSRPAQAKTIIVLTPESDEALQKFKEQLILKSYSPSTIRTYTNEFIPFLQTINNIPAYGFTTARIKDYLVLL